MEKPQNVLFNRLFDQKHSYLFSLFIFSFYLFVCYSSMSYCAWLTVRDYILFDSVSCFVNSFMYFIFHVYCFIIGFIVNDFKDPWCIKKIFNMDNKTLSVMHFLSIRWKIWAMLVSFILLTIFLWSKISIFCIWELVVLFCKRMKFSRKMWLLIILKVTKKQGFILSLEDIFSEKPHGWRGGGVGCWGRIEGVCNGRWQIDPTPSMIPNWRHWQHY